MKEYLLDDKNYRLSIFPIIHQDIYKFAEDLQHTFWTTTEVKFEQDQQFLKMATEGEKNLLKYIIGYFLTQDNDVIDIIYNKILKCIKVPEHKAFEVLKGANEQIHAETYSNAAFSYFNSSMNEIYNIQEDPAIKEKLKWIDKWIGNIVLDNIEEDSDSFAKMIISMCILEGIGFQGLFCAVHVLCEDGKFPALRFSNELIARDEGVHADFYIHIYKNYVKNKLSTKEIHKMIKDLIKIEDRFIESALAFEVLGMNREKMEQYVRYIANNHCDRLQILRVFPDIEKNPYPTTLKLNTKVKANFFEGRDSNYSRVDAGDEVNYDWKKITDF